MAMGPTAAGLAGLSLRDLEYAAAVDSHRHFGRAAEQCGVSQAALSGQLRKLEELLGARLFERGARRVAPTESGAVLLPRIGRVLEEAHALLELARRGEEPLAGRVRLGAIATLGPYYLPHVLRRLREEFPRLRLQLTEGQTAGLLDQLRHGALDAAFIALLDGGRAAAAGLVEAPLFFEPFLLVAPAGHPLADLPRPRLDDLVGDDLILLEDGHCLRDQALALCARSSRHARHAASVETLWHMIAAGEGYSLLPALSLAGRATARDDLAALVRVGGIDDAAAGRAIGMVWRATDPRAADFRAIAAALRGRLPEGVSPLDGAEMPHTPNIARSV